MSRFPDSQKRKRPIKLYFAVSEGERELIRERMELIGITNMGAYIRKMSIDGYIVKLDMTDVRELIRLLSITSNNLNQYARRANETGSIYAADIEDLRSRMDEVWEAANGILKGFSGIH